MEKAIKNTSISSDMELSGLCNLLLADLQSIIDSARTNLALRANAELTMMYWHIGERINREVLGNRRAEYGKQIVSMVSRQLQDIYGTKGFEPRSIRRMMQFAGKFPDLQIVSTLSTKLSWSHFIEILPLSAPLQSEFYLTMAASERWSVRLLRKKIDAMQIEDFPREHLPQSLRSSSTG